MIAMHSEASHLCATESRSLLVANQRLTVQSFVSWVVIGKVKDMIRLREAVAEGDLVCSTVTVLGVLHCHSE
jgi:hypothetical protein